MNPEQLFALPVSQEMFYLLPLFSGLYRPSQENHLEKKSRMNYMTQNEVEEWELHLKTTPRVQAVSTLENPETVMDWFDGDERQVKCATNRAFGPLGLRHLLCLLIALEEAGRTGQLVWDVNQHLERMGYTRTKNGSFDPKRKLLTSNIIKVFVLIAYNITYMTVNRREEEIKLPSLFSVEDNPDPSYQKGIISEPITLRANDWYETVYNSRPQYVRLLKKLPRENHQRNPLVIYLTTLLSVHWRMAELVDGEVVVTRSLKNLMDWCDLDTEGYKRNQYRDRLYSQLAYMEEQDYLGHWRVTEEDSFTDTMVTLVAPNWLQRILTDIREQSDVERREVTMTVEMVQDIMEQKGLNQRQFAEEIGVSRNTVNMVLNGNRAISQRFAQSVHDRFDNCNPPE